MSICPADLSRLVDQHWGTLRRWIGVHHASVDDIIQEAFIRLARQSPPPDQPLAWLMTTSRRIAINEGIRDGRRRQREQHATSDRVQHSQTVDHDTLDAIDQLDDLSREIVVAKIWGNFNLDEIATMTGVSRSRVHRTYHDALQTLKQVLASHE